METLPGRSLTIRTTGTTAIVWIELSSIRTIGDDRVKFEAITWKHSQTIGQPRSQGLSSSRPKLLNQLDEDGTASRPEPDGTDFRFFRYRQ